MCPCLCINHPPGPIAQKGSVIVIFFKREFLGKEELLGREAVEEDVALGVSG